ncbi:hypothetical protein G7K_2640-t1 [Saitoella complicata NRRL Y-17804]|uniref:Uncharacterized protein n=1 Tax=Saitoella complicata (strain BCRC 22490 / CBS 7301 / JCM 7358 / NBRC 10748 / NRRL Y-17804) TaxID=698492 RepID=A0A0E9NF32_SAICN|nr:hypothetical protein G7K_2640-t1 [Saitoella complicata NRRL Y-17804]
MHEEKSGMIRKSAHPCQQSMAGKKRRHHQPISTRTATSSLEMKLHIQGWCLPVVFYATGRWATDKGFAPGLPYAFACRSIGTYGCVNSNQFI